jgi:hypothetical protein
MSKKSGEDVAVIVVCLLFVIAGICISVVALCILDATHPENTIWMFAGISRKLSDKLIFLISFVGLAAGFLGGRIMNRYEYPEDYPSKKKESDPEPSKIRKLTLPCSKI